MSSRKALLALLAAALLPACEVDVDDGSTVPAVTSRISVSAAGAQANRASENPDVTPDGRYVVFQSRSSNLVPDDDNDRVDVFRKDLSTGEVVLVSASELGESGDGDSVNPSISADGRRVAFESTSTNLAATDGDPLPDVYVKDLGDGAVTHVSQSSLGGPPAGTVDGSGKPRLSANGRYVVFLSDGSDLVEDPIILFTAQLVYRRDLDPGGGTILVSRDVFGESPAGVCDHPSVSDDGRYVAFASFDSTLVDDDSNGAPDVFVRDLQLGTTERISGVNAAGSSARPRITPDGRFVVFESAAPDLVPDDDNGFPDVFLWDRQDPSALVALSIGLDGTTGFGESVAAVVTPDGRYAVFRSSAPNLVVGDTNEEADHFWRDRVLGKTYRVSVRTGGAESQGESFGTPTLTADGRMAIFASNGVDLVVGDSNGSIDVFIRGPHH